MSNYATTRTEITSANPNLPTPAQYGEVMRGFDTQADLPVTYQLATEFAVCDQWFASLPGPTFPNRFFADGVSSAGWADSPTSTTIGNWLRPGGGFVYPSGSSIYDAFNKAGLQFRLYSDHNGTMAGAVPQVAMLKGITYMVQTNSFASFATDLQGPYPYSYTFIEPNYGDVFGGSYTGGSSEHPTDGVAEGEGSSRPRTRRSATRHTGRRACSSSLTTSMAASTTRSSGPAGTQATVGARPGHQPGWLPVRLLRHPGAGSHRVAMDPPRRPSITRCTTTPSVLATLEHLFRVPPLTAARDANANNLLHLLSEPTPTPRREVEVAGRAT